MKSAPENVAATGPAATRQQAFGFHKLTLLERLGVWLSHRAVARVIKQYRRPEILDIGSGFRCALLVHFSRQSGPSTALDVQIDQEFARRHHLTAIESRLEDAWDRLPHRTFDVVTMINVLEHLPEPAIALQRSHACLRSGGALVINVPTWFGKSVHEVQAFRLGLSSAVEIDDHRHYFDKRDLWPLLVRAGFRPSMIHMRYHKFRINLFTTARCG